LVTGNHADEWKGALKLYLAAGWQVLRQKGSHVVVGKGAEREVIPMHRELKKGLENHLKKGLKGV
jgi:predicted RNA binding protein YcfA (HicA-like mRNA interferase family)